ncbi:MAG: LacI family DNA-binding transcriptional regulator [Balneolaceae bacterium]
MGNTIYDIAKAANVSIATVSRVMNNNGKVRTKTRDKVLKIADEMGYHPQAFAQGLASKKKNTIAVVVPMISNYFFMEVLAGIQDQVTNHEYELTVLNIKSDEDLFNQVEHQLKRQFAEGYIFISIHFEDEKWKKLQKYEPSIVIIDDYFGDFDSVSVDNRKGAFKATSYFIEQGYERIALLSAVESSKPVKQRIEGYQAALEYAGLPFDRSLIISSGSTYRDGFTEKDGYLAMKKILSLDPLPEACYSVSDVKAIGAIKAMDEMGIRIPMISNDNLAIAEYIGLSTVAQPMYEMGKIASQHVMDRIGEGTKDVEHTIYSPELILRSSSEKIKP